MRNEFVFVFLLLFLIYILVGLPLLGAIAYALDATVLDFTGVMLFAFITEYGE